MFMKIHRNVLNGFSDGRRMGNQKPRASEWSLAFSPGKAKLVAVMESPESSSFGLYQQFSKCIQGPLGVP
jgi:hypothetical protein